MDLNAHLLLVLLVGILACVGLNLTVLQLDAVANLLQVVCGDVLVKIYVINLLLEELWVSELGCHVTIVGEKQYTCGVAVETTYGIDALTACVLHEIHHGLALLWVVACRNVVLRFVKKHIHLLLDAYRLVVELHLIGAQHLCSKFSYNLTIYGDYSCLYIFVSLSTAADTCIGKILVEANRLIWVVVLLLVLDTLLHAIFCIGVIARSVLAESATLLAISSATALLVAASLLISSALLAISATTALLVAATLLESTALVLGIESTLLLVISILLLAITSALLISSALLAISATTALLVAAATTLLVAASLLITSALLALWVVASLVVVISWTIRRALWCTCLKSCSESFGAESAFVLLRSVKRCRTWTLSVVDTWTW